MKWILPGCFVFALATVASAGASAVAEEPVPEANDKDQALDSVDNLRHLLESPLPGETGPPPRRSADTGLGGFAGKMVTRITAVNPPPGFTPVDDADIPLGIPLDAALVRRAVMRLWDTGHYRDVQVYARQGPGDSTELLIEVKPMLRVRKLDVNGNKALDDDEVGRAVDFAPGRTIQPDPEVLRKLRRKLQKAYADRGYREARASLRIETTKEPGGVALIVDVEEGRPERYARIRTPGLPEDLPDPDLVESVGLEKGMVRNRENVEKAVQELAQKIADAGYRDARVKQFRERRLDRYDIELIVPVEAGIQTQFLFEGNVHFRTGEIADQLVGEGLLRTSPESLELGLTRLKDHYRAHGFFHIRFRGSRRCFRDKKNTQTLSISETCRANTEQQMILIRISEGPPVEVAHIDFSGNEFYSDDHLEDELFAFMKEKIEKAEIFQPLTTETVDDLGLSDKRPHGMGRPRGMKSPRAKQTRTYVPGLYLELMQHLSAIYQEQGFLGVRATDTCQIERLTSRTFRGMEFVPFSIERPDESAQNDGGELKPPCLLINRDRDQLIVVVTIQEGAQTRLNEIAFEGNSVFPARTLQEVTGLSISDPYNEYRVRESSQEIAAFYHGTGYMFASTSWDKSFSLDMERARVGFHVNEGPQVRVGRIRIEGAQMTSKKLIRERLTFETGDLVTPESIEESQQRLMELGILDSATIQLISPDVPAEVKNVKVLVTEGNPQYLELRGGIATVEGLRGGFEYGYRNLAGWALNARLRARANYRLFFLGSDSPLISELEKYYNDRTVNLLKKIEHHLLAGVGQPHLPGTKGLLGWGIDATKELVNEPAFSADRITSFVRLTTTQALGLKYRRAFVAELRTGVERTDLIVFAKQALTDDEGESTINPVYLSFLRMPDDVSIFWVTGLKLTLDLRNHPFNPTRGIAISLVGDLVRSLSGFAPEYVEAESATVVGQDAPDFDEQLASGDIIRIDKLSKLIRTQATVSGYIPFGETDMTLALSVSAGYVFHLANNSTTWADRYFYAGGVDTLRGFPEESLVPEDIYQYWKTTLLNSSDEAGELLKSAGGEAMLLARAEFRYPLAKGFYGALFSEVGNVWRDKKKIDLVDIEPLRVHLRPVAGGGIRYLTPLGPLSFDLGVNLFRRPHEELFAWFFSIGTAF